MNATITSQQAKAILEIGRLFAGSLPEDQQARKASEILNRYCGKRTTWAQEEAILDAAEALSAGVGPVSPQRKAILEIGALYAKSRPGERTWRKANAIFDRHFPGASEEQAWTIFTAADDVSELLQRQMRSGERNAAIDALCATAERAFCNIHETPVTFVTAPQPKDVLFSGLTRLISDVEKAGIKFALVATLQDGTSHYAGNVPREVGDFMMREYLGDCGLPSNASTTVH
jgi:hypothetical protein